METQTTQKQLEKPMVAKPVFRAATVTEMFQRLCEQLEEVRIVQNSMQDQLNDLWKKQIEVMKP